MSHLIHNQWTRGRSRFELGNVVSQLGKLDGLFPMPMVLDPSIGEEIVILIRDETPFMSDLCRVAPFQLMMKNGCVAMESGPLAFFLFWVEHPKLPGKPFAAWDCYLNPKDQNQLQRWRNLSIQSHWHVILIGEGGHQREFFEFENCYALESSLDLIVDACRDLPMRDFDSAKRSFMTQYSIDDMFKIC